MNKILNLDVSKDDSDYVPIIYGRVGDSLMQTVTANVTDNDQQLDLNGAEITFEGTLNGGKVSIFDSENVTKNTAELKKGTFSYTFPSRAFSQEGRYDRAYFSFIKDGKRNTTGDFRIFVYGNSDIDAEEAKTVITQYNKLVAELNELQKKNIDSLNKDITSIKSELDSLQVKIGEYETSVKKTSDEAIQKVTSIQSAAVSAIENTKNSATQTVNTTRDTAVTTINNTKTSAVTTVTNTKDSAVTSINSSKDQAITAVDNAIKKMDEQGVYTKTESDARYAEKSQTFTKAEVQALVASIKVVPPVGTLITNSQSTFDPNIEYPGTTWHRIKGRIIMGVDESDPDFAVSGKMGGEKAHKLSIGELPAHSFEYKTNSVNNLVQVSPSSVYGRTSDRTEKTNTLGSDEPHNNMPPYITEYVWERTA